MGNFDIILKSININTFEYKCFNSCSQSSLDPTKVTLNVNAWRTI